MLTKTRLILAAPIAVMLAASPAIAAETLCGSRDSVLKQLASEYQEAPVGIGLASNGAVVELLTSSSGSWTLLVTMPKGSTCLMGTGEAWQPIARKVSFTTEKDS
ncbi:MAG: hypothetical protein JNL04_17610 [Rhodospirillaceae bacterium]|jgi:hypothetical protein|nr:hypothetical protein [Rhodospirillaceae bacterium]